MNPSHFGLKITGTKAFNGELRGITDKFGPEPRTKAAQRRYYENIQREIQKDLARGTVVLIEY